MLVISRISGGLVLLAAALSSSGALGQGESKKNCGSGRRPGINGCVDAVPRARSKAPPAQAASAPKPPAPEQSFRLPPETHAATKMAERRLLLQELERLERLLKVTPKNAPERAAMVKRLAETYAELAQRAEYDREVARIRAERAERESKAEAAPRTRPRKPTTL